MNAPARINLGAEALPWSRRIWQRIRSWFYGAEGNAEKPMVAAKAVLKPHVFGPDFGIGNAFSIHEILDRLPHYFNDIKALRKHDPDAYDVFSQLGAPIATSRSLFVSGAISPEVLKSPPMIRCVFYGQGDNGEFDRIPAALSYMQYMGSGQVCVGRDGGLVSLPSGGPCYRFVMAWTTKRGHSIAHTCFVQIQDDGRVEVLPERSIVVTKTKMRGKGRGGRGGSTFYERTVSPVAEKPKWIDELAFANKQTPEVAIQTICAITMSSERPRSAILVRASKGRDVASWTIDRRDAKRFFKQRETGDASDGRRKRVLHYVAPFTRKTSNGEQKVREHFRGERAFDWNGYHIEISALGFHHDDFFDASIPAFEDERNGKIMTMKDAGRKIQARYSKPVFLSKRRAQSARA